MKKFLSITVLLSLLVSISNLTSFAYCPAPSCCPPEPCCSSKSVKEAVSDLKSEHYKNLYEEQKRINDQTRWQNDLYRWSQLERDLDAQRDRKELLRLKRNEDERKSREEQLRLQKFKSEEAWKKIETANAKIDETYAHIIKANPCMKAAIEDINRAVYSADPDDVRKTISKLESEKESLESYKRSLTLSSDTTVGQLENVKNRLQAIDYELDILYDHYRKNNEYDKKLNELNRQKAELTRQKDNTFLAGFLAITIGVLATIFGLSVASGCH